MAAFVFVAYERIIKTGGNHELKCNSRKKTSENIAISDYSSHVQCHVLEVVQLVEAVMSGRGNSNLCIYNKTLPPTNPQWLEQK
jgi:hypothetical protein